MALAAPSETLAYAADISDTGLSSEQQQRVQTVQQQCRGPFRYACGTRVMEVVEVVAHSGGREGRWLYL